MSDKQADETKMENEQFPATAAPTRAQQLAVVSALWHMPTLQAELQRRVDLGISVMNAVAGIRAEMEDAGRIEARRAGGNHDEV